MEEPEAERREARSTVTRAPSQSTALVVAGVLVVLGGFAALSRGSEQPTDRRADRPADDVQQTTTSIVATTTDSQERAGAESGGSIIGAAPIRGTVTPLVDGDNGVYDVGLVTGDRFRVSLPIDLATEMALVYDEDAAIVRLEGSETAVELSFRYCGIDPGRVNAHGAIVEVDGRSATVCRFDDLLVMEVVNVAGQSIDPDGLDVRPIAVGEARGSRLAEIEPRLATCVDCSPVGPMTYPEDSVVVNRTWLSTVTAVDEGTLATRWTIETGPADVYLAASDDFVFLDVVGGPFLAVDPGTGDELWRVDRDDGERGGSLTQIDATFAILMSSFSGEGDARPPVVRAIDPSNGTVLWEAEGRESAEWQWIEPLIVGGVLIAMDVLDRADPYDFDAVGAKLWGFDAASGHRVWTQDLNGAANSYSSASQIVAEQDSTGGQVVLARTPNGVVARVDPSTGRLIGE